ncbi:MAG: hypothetical protein M3N23_03690 [Pseudomonadota bacterium]|nr:hypothetical protein [Pseudomonadota bacterium]
MKPLAVAITTTGALVMALIATACLADGLKSIDGITSDGYQIAADFEAPPYRIEIWRQKKDRHLIDGSARLFDNEPCEFQLKTNRHGREVRSFSCAKNAKSPLAGTRYLGHQSGGICERGDPSFRYICVEGCNNNKRAPKTMSQDYYEC